ncbi:acyl-CoA desaturase [Streptomyces sp. NWU339]|uniref:fatty acid desaturase family protein n=1 Tax=Streptomyces sp. NWU339 TaxID=2185284 RepID=UPI000D683134|nr:acyl-CoA desaturase [Streptomyces sp. NWU339]PWI04770.1 acyl-CoA desaturase [Streptomyces sp. NWU339]
MAAALGLAPPEADAFGRELDRIRAEVLEDLGAEDARYIRTLVTVHRSLEAGGRAALAVSLLPPAWLAGTAMLTTAKVLENMELGHNILHGQWDWMRDPAIHSTTWEWDFPTPAAAWKHTHNDLHHTWTNVVGRDRDLGYVAMRMSEDQPWHPIHLLQPLYGGPLLAPVFEWAIALYDLEPEAVVQGRKSVRAFLGDLAGMARKAARQFTKDYVLFPLLAGPSALPCLLGNLTANTARNIWAHTVIFCGHFPAGAESFAEDEIEGESRGEWYVRQALGSANIDGGPLLHILTGNLSHQIEHHLFPDLPSNRYAEIAPRVRELCEKFGIPYTTGPLLRQYASTWARIWRMGLP